MVKGLVVSIFITLMLVGCGSPKIDTSSDEKMKTSIEKVKKSLSDEKKQEFEDALKVVYFSKVNFDLKSIMALGTQETANNMINEAKSLLNNKTADEVIQEAKKIKDKILEDEKQNALKEINELENKKILVQKSVEELKKVEIGDLNFNREKQQYSSYLKPTITINLKNNTDKAIAKVYAVGIIQTEGRAVPWIKEEFNYTIDGGIEPGETNKSVLAPNTFSVWGTAHIGENATFNINILRIDGADGNPIATLENFSEKDNQRLEALKSKYLSK
ncbi:hypothetical protein H0A43_07285 [Arcobacter lanthieri]|uniref:DUF6694 family lipoprotein n=1 Tax=Aliarcobacter lanthieri TaxID=1355374 RepID=UPI00192435AE|nr:DUF6694 family lipoprotein [Aliarcobacter lanthieri]MBL3520274.1 hypothetical protein [Aliarcobacter lanthieri]